MNMPVTLKWLDVCAVNDIVPWTGVGALVNGEQAAVFRTPLGLFAIGNHDPFSGANVLARGLVGDLGGKLCVASPIYKQHFALDSGECLEDASVRLPVYSVRENNGRVEIAYEEAA